MKNKLSLYLIFLWSANFYPLRAQEPLPPVTWKLKLIEKGTKRALSGVSVYLLPQKVKVISNSDGIAELTLNAQKETEAPLLIINHSGYKRFEREINLAELLSQGQANEENIYLERQSYLRASFESTVTEQVKPRDQQMQGLQQEQFLIMPGSFGGDPIRAAQNLPGVANNGASAEIVIQGAGPDDTAYYIEDHKVPIVFHFGGFSSVFTPEAIDRVDYLSSGYGAEYSKALGGIIGLKTKNLSNNKAASNKRHLAFMDFFNVGALTQGSTSDDQQQEQQSYLISGRYSYVGKVLKKIAEDSEDLSLTAAPSYYDINALWNKKLNDKINFKISAVASKDQLELTFKKPANNDPSFTGELSNETSFYRVIPKLTTKLNATTDMEHSVALGEDRILVQLGGQYLDITSRVLSHRSELTHQWNDQHRSFVGMDHYIPWTDVRINLPNNYELGGVSNPFSTGEERKFTVNSHQPEWGAYLRHQWFWGERVGEDWRWSFSPQVRFDHFSRSSESFFQPRAQVGHQVNASLSLKAAAGYYAQPPRPQEASSQYGNNQIKSPYAYHYGVGWKYQPIDRSTGHWEIGNNYFFKTLKRLILGDVSQNYNNDGTGKIYGSEIFGRYQYGEWSGQLAYSFLNSKRQIPGYGSVPSEFDQTHNLNLIGSYQRGLWTYGARWRIVTGNPYTPVNGATFDSDNDVYVPLRGALYSQRYDYFTSLDVRIDRKIIFNEWMLTAYLDIQNLTNAKNQQMIEYSYNYQQSEKVNGLPIIPTIGLKGEF